VIGAPTHVRAERELWPAIERLSTGREEERLNLETSARPVTPLGMPDAHLNVRRRGRGVHPPFRHGFENKRLAKCIPV